MYIRVPLVRVWKFSH